MQNIINIIKNMLSLHPEHNDNNTYLINNPITLATIRKQEKVITDIADILKVNKSDIKTKLIKLLISINDFELESFMLIKHYKINDSELKSFILARFSNKFDDIVSEINFLVSYEKELKKKFERTAVNEFGKIVEKILDDEFAKLEIKKLNK